MTDTLSLKQLKEKNALEDGQTPVEAKPKQEVKLDEYVEEKPELKADEVGTEIEHDDDVSDADSESWKQPEEAEASENEQSGFKPNSAIGKVRKQLRAKINERDEELELLKAKIQKLESGSGQAPRQAQQRPKLEQYDYDEDKYNDALDAYYESKIDSRVANTQQSQSKKAQEEALKQAKESALNAHYIRAEKLVESGSVSEDEYHSADKSLRMSLEKAFPNNGESITDDLIVTLNDLGDGSEKLLYQLGINSAKRDQFIAKLKTSPYSAVAYLGMLHATINSPNKRKSSAPKPATQIKGESGGKAENLYQQWKKLDGDPSRISIKRKAKASGVDTSNWN